MKRELLRVTVNDVEYELYINPKRLLVEVIRDELGFTGTKRACDTVSCGCCTVMVEGMAVKSCSVLAMQVDGLRVKTVEGLEVDGKMDPIQRGFLDEGAFQCGFCTSGMLMSARALLDENPNPTKEEMKDGIEGNLCRCTGYNSIIRAMTRVANGQYKEEQA